MERTDYEISLLEFRQSLTEQLDKLRKQNPISLQQHKLLTNLLIRVKIKIRNYRRERLYVQS